MNRLLSLFAAFCFTMALFLSSPTAHAEQSADCGKASAEITAQSLTMAAIQPAMLSDASSATLINASLDGPQAGCSLCYENCLFDCFSSGGQNCDLICYNRCLREGPPC